jgi:hypothetical protein
VQRLAGSYKIQIYKYFGTTSIGWECMREYDKLVAVALVFKYFPFQGCFGRQSEYIVD